ncbi:cell wall-binding repeat-containing protein [Dactylosporangium sp. NPDC051485]|uniref:cell wall-binding repeat-containing protein n=1 Tax=Dactylosporangium sp. NPDC051485 TaxID=3154846 RepID=UPI00343ED5D8
MSSTLSRRGMLRAVAAAAATTAAAPFVMSATERAASATLPGEVGKITYSAFGKVYIADANGANARELAYSDVSGGEWAPDGSRFFFGSGSQLYSVRPDGTGMVSLIDVPTHSARNLTVTQDGRFVVFSDLNTGLRYVGTGGNWFDSALLVASASQADRPTVAVDGTIYYDQFAEFNSHWIIRFDSQNQNGPQRILTDGWDPDVSPDGSQIVFVRSDYETDKAQLWLAGSDGSNPVQLTTEAAAGAWNVQPKWSPDGSTILFASATSHLTATGIKKINVASKVVTPVVAVGAFPTWQPVKSGLVERVWGQTALDTAIATSRWNYAGHGQTGTGLTQAKAVVLSRNDVYYDALSGSALAVNKEAPLLITPRDGLSASVEAEIKRVLGNSGHVYLLGGTAALPAPIENRLKSLGYTTHRVAGESLFDTAIAVANAITTTPDTIILSTALNYYDALAAGAAAGANPGTVIVLTAGDMLTPETVAYLRKFNPTQVDIVTAGGPADRALINAYNRGQLPSWVGLQWGRWDLVGQTAQDTARMIAEFFFGSPRYAGIATMTSWYDALTGGAMIGANFGPLLLTAPNSLDHQVSDYLSANSAAMADVVLIGGPNALSPNLVPQLGNAFSLPGHYTTSETTPENSLQAKAQAKSLAATDPKTRSPKGTSDKAPGLKTKKTMVKQ